MPDTSDSLPEKERLLYIQSELSNINYSLNEAGKYLMSVYILLSLGLFPNNQNN